MVTLQDISVQLMKPAKDLANWSFPLSQVLEEYYALLEEPDNINFGEAALVLQNSANAYVHRVECLFDEMAVLKQTFYEKEGAKKAAQHERKSAKLCNLEDFELVDLENEVGKNIDMKDQNEALKSVKLISRRFAQLENASGVQSHLPIYTYDVHGEVIGKKYDFRCNQATDINGVLVDELTPDDFERARGSCIKERRNPSLTSSETTTQGTGTSGYHSITSPDGYNMTNNDYTEDFEMDNDSIENIGNDDHALDNLEISMQSVGDPEHKDQSDCDCLQNRLESEDTTDNSSIENTSGKEDCTLLTDKTLVDKSASGIRKNSTQNSSDTIQGKEPEVPNPNGEDTIETHANRETAKPQKRRSERSKESTHSVLDINRNTLKITPALRNRRSIPSPTKVPGSNSLTKTREESPRKRKIPSKTRKQKCLTKLTLHEFALCDAKEYPSLLKSRFKQLRKDELEDMQRTFDQCFGIVQECVSSNYEAVTSVAMDLLGFRLALNKDSSEDDILDTSRSPSPIPIETAEIESRGTPGFSSPCSDWVQADLSYSPPDYQRIIEDKMREIFKECDVTTELQRTVANWHRSLQPKLSEAEQRQAFRIHDYTSHILDTLRSLDQKKCKFDGVVRGKPACEVARYFLASLQLASTYNVDINASNDSGPGMEIVLLEMKENCKKAKG